MRILKWSFVLFCCTAQHLVAQTTSTNTIPAPANSTGVQTAVSNPASSPGNAPSAALTNPFVRPMPSRPNPVAIPQYPKILGWDAEVKEVTVTNGALLTSFVFAATNISTNNAIITGTQTSCGCTVAKLPAEPWILAPGSNGQIQVAVNLAGKVGSLNKTIHVFLSNQPPAMLTVKINIPPPPPMSEAERARNRELAQVDAQAVFKGSCADCHLTPGRGRIGASLYDTMCGVCHEVAGDRRASMVPNLHSLKQHTDFDFWKDVITNGKTNTLMPAFSIAKGGPLNEVQINSVAEYLARNISRNYRPMIPANARMTNAQGFPTRPIPGLKPLPPIKSLDAIAPPTVPVVPPIAPVTPPTPPSTNAAN